MGQKDKKSRVSHVINNSYDYMNGKIQAEDQFGGQVKLNYNGKGSF